MSTAFIQGFRRLAAAPGLVLLVWLVNLVVALPAAVLVEEAIHRSISTSLQRESLRTGFDTGWYGEFQAEAEGLPATISPSQVGIGGVLDVLDGWWDGDLFRMPPSLIAFGVVFSLLWLFLLGGVISRFRRSNRRMSPAEVAAHGRRYFPRLLRLALLSAPLYYGIFRFAAWIFPKLEHATRDVTVETKVLALSLPAAALVVVALAFVKLISDYAKIAIIVEDRRSALLALLSGCAFIARRPASTFGLVALFGLLTLGVIAGFSRVAPGAGESSWWGILLAIVVSQVFLVLKMGLRLGLVASEVALYEEVRGTR